MAEKTKETILKLRWLILILMGLVIFGSYYAYDAVSPVADFIMKGMDISSAQFGLFFSVYSLPNIIMVLLGGIFLDIIGIRKAGTIFAALCAIGVFITASGSTLLIMLIGRFIYGLGSESLIITMDKILSRWFKGKELAFAFGLLITIARLGTIAAFNSAANIQQWSGSWRMAIWVSAVIMFVSFLLFLVYSGIDRSKEKYFKREKKEGQEEKFSFQDIYKFRPSYWFVCVLCMTFYSAIFPFTAFSTVLLQTKFGFSAVLGGRYTSMIFTASMIFTPLLGLLVDKIGKRGIMLIFGSLLLVPAHSILGLTQIHPAIPMIMIGVSFSLVPAALWPVIPIMVEERRLGTAFGMMTGIQNIGLTIFPFLAGKIRDLSGGEFTNTMIMFACLGFIGLVFSLLLKSADKREKVGIELPTMLAQAGE
ncbi:MAG: MFS transporter [Candidatus Aminicenantes bacterium]|nr:MFS transporter [Candidatus Aminicenantes bacterium]